MAAPHETDADRFAGGAARTAASIRADGWWEAGAIGRGVDVAVVDTGIAPVELLTGRLIAGVDLTGGNDPFNDRSGHGTHLAGIIAGRTTHVGSFSGIAPASRVVSVKVAHDDADTDVASVIAGLEWVLRYGRDDELAIRVVNLAFCSVPLATHRIDPLADVAEQLWQAGVLVVTAAGRWTGGGLTSPAYDPHLLAVGAHDDDGQDLDGGDDAPAGRRGPDLFAPGFEIVGPRAPGSTADRVGSRRGNAAGLVRGSGTSQAAAVVSGAAALLLGRRPDLSPDGVKRALVGGARNGPAGRLLDLSDIDVDELEDPLGRDRIPVGAGSRWAGSRWAGSRWAGSRWAGSRWAGSRWA